MQSSISIRVMLLFSAYFPLFIAIAIQHITWKMPNITSKKDILHQEISAILMEPKYLLSFLSMIMIVVSLVSCVFIIVYVKDAVRSRVGPTRVKVASIKTRETDVLTYLVTYVLPLFTLSSTTWRDACVLVFTVVLVLWLSLRTDMLYVNPLLLLMKYHIYAVETPHGEMLLLSRFDKTQIRVGESRICYRLQKGYVLIDGD